MTEYLRVKQTETGHELTVSRTAYEFAPETYEVLDKPATDAGSNPLAPKYKTSVATAAEKKAQSGQKAESTKENS